MRAPSPAAAEPAIELVGVAKHYGAFRAVEGVDLRIRRGEVFGLIGHNGAGKTTLFKLMLGLLPASAGEVRIAGADVRGPDFRAVRRRIGYLPENVALWDNLSGRETLRFFARLKGAPESDCATVLARVGLVDAAARPVREYSKGMRQRLGFAQALLGRPQVLFLDEPTVGLDPRAIRDFYAILRELRAEGVTMVITSHVLAELQERVDRLAIIAGGRVQAVGSVQELRERHRMPLVVSLRTASDATLAEALARLPGLVEAPQPEPGGWRLQCERGAKMALLGVVASLGPAIQDVQIAEPSLEDLFFDLGLPEHARTAREGA